MTNILDYLLWRGDIAFENDPFNEIDGAICARLSYLPFERILKAGEEITLKNAAEKMLKIENIEEKVLIKDDYKLIKALKESNRYNSAYAFGFVHKTDRQSQTQFCALTLRLSDNLFCVCFRGTDNTLIGWKEDFNMGLMCPVPAQRSAAEYLEKILSGFDNKFIIAGHSKGGNLAVYSAAYCREDLKNKITAVYNYDGPGFTDTVLESDGYKNICKRVNTFVPQSSVVGMLLGHKENFFTVHSENSGLMQHDIYSWDVEGKNFIFLESVNNSSVFVDSTVKAWFSDLTPYQLEVFVEAVFKVANETNAETLHEMGEKWFDSAVSVLKSVKNLDETTRKTAMEAIKILLKSTKSGFKKVTDKNT